MNFGIKKGFLKQKYAILQNSRRFAFENMHELCQIHPENHFSVAKTGRFRPISPQNR